MFTELDWHHYTSETYWERFPQVNWEDYVAKHGDTIVVDGIKRKLVAKYIGWGVVQISKAPLPNGGSDV